MIKRPFPSLLQFISTFKEKIPIKIIAATHFTNFQQQETTMYIQKHGTAKKILMSSTQALN